MTALKSTRRTFLLSGAALAACAPTIQGADTIGAPIDFTARVDGWTADILRLSPEGATTLALPEPMMGGRYKDRLDDRSAASQTEQKALAARLAREIHAINREPLSQQDKLTYDVLAAAFDLNADMARPRYGNFGFGNGANPYVLDQQAPAFVNLPDFFDSQHTIANLDDAEAYVARLGQVAGALDAETERANADAAIGVIAPDFIIAKTLVALDGTIATPVERQVYMTGLRRKLDALIASSPDTRARADALYAQAEGVMRNDILPAHQRTADALRELQPRSSHQAGIMHRPDGDAYYNSALHYFTTTNLPPDEVHRIGLARVAEIQARADTALRQEGLTNGSVGARMAEMTRDPARRYANSDEGRAQILADTRARIERVQREAPQWFAHLPRAAIEVRRMPPVVEAVQSAAYYQRPALDGSRPGVYYMTLRDMNTVSRVDLATVTHHEAVPGHHFQIALAQEQDMPLLRRIAIFNAYTEGWALYGEQIVDEMGYYNDDNEGRIGYYRWALWRGVRLVVDTGIHTKGWTREQALQYMQETLGDDPTIIGNELDRYCVWPGQACAYELGRREIVRLREAARASMGERFNLRGFHDAVLLNGALPLSVLASQVQAWSSGPA